DLKRSERFKVFHSLLGATSVVVGTRSAIYAPVANLGLICMADDLDDSWREQGSPNTHVRELALMRAGDKVSLLFAAPYRSLEVQRLVDIGYLAEHPKDSAPPRISFTEPGLRLDSASFEMAKESITQLPTANPAENDNAAIVADTFGNQLAAAMSAECVANSTPLASHAVRPTSEEEGPVASERLPR
ncbi:MAG: hypothetical protein EBV98_05375, partial [Actinobacteria bacterium]|nr:hypothetical protein [Actinomycetota bacterium]